MLGIKCAIFFSLCSFFFGVAVGSLWFPPYARTSNKEPVNVDFCFLLRNPDLLGSRRFITYANITPLVPHAPVLESGACPNMGASFVEQLDRQDFISELNRRFHNNPYDPVRVEFEGTLYKPSLLRRLWFGTVMKFGLRGDQTPPITIRAYKAVGDLGGQSPSEIPSTGDVITKPSANTLLHESGHFADPPKQQ